MKTVNDLMAAYRESPVWCRLSVNSRRVYEYGLWHWLGTEPLDPASLTKMARIIRDRLLSKRTPGAARNFLTASSAMFSWGVDAGFLDSNPMNSIRVRIPKISHARWTDAQINATMAQADPVTRAAIALALATGQRRSDIASARYGQFFWKDGKLFWNVRQGKTGTYLILPIPPHTAQMIMDIGTEDPRLFQTSGPAIAKSVKMAAQRAGCPGLTFHGLRHTAAARMAEAGCTASEIASVTGHKTLSMISVYTKQADQAAMAVKAMERVEART